MNLIVSVGSPQSSQQDQSGNITDEEVELKQNISRSRNPSNDLMIEEPRSSRAPARCPPERGGGGSKEVLASADMGNNSKHIVDINKDPLNVEKVKEGLAESRTKLQLNASSNDVKALKSENAPNNSHPLLTKANSTKEDPSAKIVSSEPPAATNEKTPKSGNSKLLKTS